MSYFLLKIGDFINSDEYRKPEWLIKMEEIKERLAGESSLILFFLIS